MKTVVAGYELGFRSKFYMKESAENPVREKE
jgi:hypothetical protein